MTGDAFTLSTGPAELVRDSMFGGGVPEEPRAVVEWGAPGAEAFLGAFKRRTYKSRLVPALDRSLYVIEYHQGEGSCCSIHPVIHDTSRSFLLSYDDIAIGLVGFEVEKSESGRTLTVKQIQGTRYRTRHSDRDTGAQAPAKSVSWQPALLTIVLAFAPLAGVDDVEVRSYTRNGYRKIQTDRFGNAHRMYDGTAQVCGFRYDAERESWIRSSTTRL